MAKRPRNRAPRPKRNVDWAKVREQWLVQNLRPTGEPGRFASYSLNDLSSALRLPYGTVRNHASREKWAELLAERRQASMERVVAQVQKDTEYVEVEVRTRQARVCDRVLNIVEVALERLERWVQDGYPLEPKEIIQLGKLAMEQQRAALGLPKAFELVQPGAKADGWEHPEERTAKHQRLRELAEKLVASLPEEETASEALRRPAKLGPDARD